MSPKSSPIISDIDHPAVKTHHELIVMASGEEEDAKDFIPNHSELMFYLAQLRNDIEYQVIDTESGNYDFDDCDRWSELYRLIGLRVYFEDERGYGGCQMMEFTTGELGLMVYVNGCSLSSAPTYYVIPKEAPAPKIGERT